MSLNIFARLDELERRLDALEQQPGVRWRGPWVDGVEYQTGDIVVRAGSMWIATTAAGPSDIPGTLHDTDDESRSAWRLCAKRGKDCPGSLERRVARLEERL